MKDKKGTELKTNDNTEKKDIGRKTRQLIFSTNAVLFTVVVLIVFVLVNLVIEQVPLNLDLTEEKLYTLSETSEKVMDGLTDKVEIYALYDRVSGEADSEKADVIKILDLYDNHENVEVSYVDISKKPAFVKNTVGENNASDYSSGDYIVKCGEKIRKIDDDDMYILYEQQINYFYAQTITTGLQVENKVTSAIVRVTSEVPKIYWSVDFGEAEVTDNNYSSFVENIEDANYDILPLNLKTQDIPEDASVIFFVRPMSDLDDKTVDKLKYWFDRGGNAFFFMDAENYDGNYITTDFKNFNKVLLRFGLEINYDVIEESEEKRYKDDEDYIFIADTIAAGALESTESYKVLCYNTRSIDILTTIDSSYYEAAALIETSVGASSISLLEDKTEPLGKRIVAASSVCYAGHAESKAVVFGSSANLQYAQTYYFGTSGIDTVKDSLDWMDIYTGENPADSIEGKTYNSVVSTVVDVTESEEKVLAFIITIAIPLVIFIIGFVVWVKRRHL
ncbi:MAG: GldG family protein [Clostridia bacterium]|nr:GldG family protein [Clostridia bacterium]